MKDSADIRKVNRHKIFTILWYGGQFSKQQLSVQTGLSIATCNTLLNEMEQAKEVIGEKKRLQDVGRETVCYKINEAYESFLCINFEVLNDMRYFTIHLLSPVGTIIEKVEKQFAILDYPAIASEVEHLLENHKNVSQILIGIPGIAKNGIIRHSDIDELENIALVSLLEKKFHIPVHMENDMHYKAYGYYCKHGKEDEIVTFAYFPTGILPGTASVHGGMIIKGRDHFAGMPGFLPFDTNRDELPALLQNMSSICFRDHRFHHYPHQPRYNCIYRGLVRQRQVFFGSEKTACNISQKNICQTSSMKMTSTAITWQECTTKHWT